MMLYIIANFKMKTRKLSQEITTKDQNPESGAGLFTVNIFQEFRNC